MRLVLLGRRNVIIVKNNGRRDFWRNVEGQRNGIWYELNYKYIYLYSMINNDQNIENGMMEWRNENDRMEDDGRMAKNQEIGKLGNDERLLK